MATQWTVESGHFKFLKTQKYRVKRVPAYRATNGLLASQLTSVELEAAEWARALNTGHKPVACHVDWA